MLSKIKKYYFTGIFGLFYILFTAQMLGMLFFTFTTSLPERGEIMNGEIAMLAAQWLALMAARYLSKKSSNSSNGYNNNGRFRR